jgi:hypothetical protein
MPDEDGPSRDAAVAVVFPRGTHMMSHEDGNAVPAPNTASEKEKAERSPDHLAPDKSSPLPPGKNEIDGKNDSGVEPEVHNADLPGKM